MPDMEHTLFADTGDLLYGPMYKRRLADTLNVTERTIGRWANDSNTIPENVPSELAEACREKAKLLLDRAKKLEGK